MGQGQEVHARRLLQQSMAAVCFVDILNLIFAYKHNATKSGRSTYEAEAFSLELSHLTSRNPKYLSFLKRNIFYLLRLAPLSTRAVLPSGELIFSLLLIICFCQQKKLTVILF